MMGISKKVAKDFKELYPDLIEKLKYISFDNVIYINCCTNRRITSASYANERAGGDNFSSGGGGGRLFWMSWPEETGSVKKINKNY